MKAINEDKNLSKEDARALFGYEDGELFRHGGKPIRALKDSHGKKYRIVAVRINGKKLMILAHRLIWNLYYGKIPEGMVIDHVDNNSLNNDIKNLQCITQSENIKRAEKTDKQKAVFSITHKKQFKSGIMGLYTDGERKYIRLPSGGRKYIAKEKTIKAGLC